jgi:hypothetical protein
MRALSKALMVFVALWAIPAYADDVAVTGRAGYLSEWEVSGKAHATTGRRTEFAGPLVMKHVGLCTTNGPVEKSGEIRFRHAGILSSRIEGLLTLGGEKCTFTARGGTTYDGVMQCPGTRGVPFSLKIE